MKGYLVSMETSSETIPMRFRVSILVPKQQWRLSPTLDSSVVHLCMEPAP